MLVKVIVRILFSMGSDPNGKFFKEAGYKLLLEHRSKCIEQAPYDTGFFSSKTGMHLDALLYRDVMLCSNSAATA